MSQTHESRKNHSQILKTVHYVCLFQTSRWARRVFLIKGRVRVCFSKALCRRSSISTTGPSEKSVRRFQEQS